MSVTIRKTLMPELSFATDLAAPARLILAIDGLDKHGKTRFALSAPKPLVYLDFDVGKEGVLEKADRADLIVAPKPFMFRPSEIAWEAENDAARTEKIMAAADPELERFRKVYLHSLTAPVIQLGNQQLMARTVVVDTGSEAWELLRLCYFGKVTQVKPHHYTAVNSLMRDLVRAAYDNHVNVIWLHKLKAEYKENAEGKGSKSGVLQRAGFSDMSYLVQANMLAYRVAANLTADTVVKWKSGEGLFEVPIAAREDGDLGFRMVVGNSRHNPALEGQTWFNEGIDFPTIAMAMLPDVDPVYWYTTAE